MQIVKGARGKNLMMAELFVESKGDFFLDYGKNATHHRIFEAAGVSHRVFGIDRGANLPTILGFLVSMVRTHSDMCIFIDGNFSESEIVVLTEWAHELPSLSLTVSEQSQNEALQVVTV